jgi:hypothetical protein
MSEIMKTKNKNITLWEQFHNPIVKSKTETKSRPLTHIHMMTTLTFMALYR